MEGTSCSSSSTSDGGQTTVKFLCSHRGEIVPRCTDGKLRYLGGETRILSADRSIPFSELCGKLKKCGWDSVGIRCQLPTDDLDTLVSMKSDDDLANIVEAYDLAGRAKIRAILFQEEEEEDDDEEEEDDDDDEEEEDEEDEDDEDDDEEDEEEEEEGGGEEEEEEEGEDDDDNDDDDADDEDEEEEEDKIYIKIEMNTRLCC